MVKEERDDVSQKLSGTTGGKSRYLWGFSPSRSGHFFEAAARRAGRGRVFPVELPSRDVYAMQTQNAAPVGGTGRGLRVAFPREPRAFGGAARGRTYPQRIYPYIRRPFGRCGDHRMYPAASSPVLLPSLHKRY